jgi:hypothetical protein
VVLVPATVPLVAVEPAVLVAAAAPVDAALVAAVLPVAPLGAGPDGGGGKLVLPDLPFP